MPQNTRTRPTVVVKANDPSELLAALPYLLGYHPRESVVVISVDDGRLGASARLDVAAVEIDPPVTGAHIGTTLSRTGVSTVLLVVYTSAQPAWLDGFVAGMARTGLQVGQGWQVDDGAYWPLDDPGDRRPTDQLQSSVISAELVAAGLAPAARRESLLDDLRPYPEPVRARLFRASAQLGSADPAQLETHLEEAVRVWAGWLGDPEIPPPPPGRSRTPRRPLSDRHLALLIAMVNEPAFRDAMIAATMSPGAPGQAAFDALAGRIDGFLPQEGSRPLERPDHDRLEAAIELLGHLVRATGCRSAMPLAMLAQLQWWAGNGAMANLLVERALEVNPRNHLARLVDGLLSGAVPPPWVPCERLDHGVATGRAGQVSPS